MGYNDHVNPDPAIRIQGLLQKRAVCQRDLEDAVENLQTIDHEISLLETT